MHRLLPSAVPLSVLAVDVSLGVDAFSRSHGDSFLVAASSAGVLTRDLKTVSVRDKDAASLWIAAVALTRTADSSHPFMSVGRGAENNITICHDSVSRFHAFIRVDPNGRWFLQDAGSRNGTRMNGTPVPARGQGNPVELLSGALVTFGACPVHFLDAAVVFQLASRFVTPPAFPGVGSRTK